MQVHMQSFNIFMMMSYLYCSYRIEHSLDIGTLKSNMKSVNLLRGRIICAIDIQRQAMKLVFKMFTILITFF